MDRGEEGHVVHATPLRPPGVRILLKVNHLWCLALNACRGVLAGAGPDHTYCMFMLQFLWWVGAVSSGRAREGGD